MKPAYKNPYKYEYKSPYMNTRPLQKPVVHQKKQRAKNNVSLFHRCISLSILLALGLCVIPKSYNNFVKPVYNSFKKDLIGSSVDIADLYNPTSNIVYNDIIGNKRVLMTPSKKTSLQSIYETDEMAPLRGQLEQLAKSYPTIQPSVFVWDYKTGKYVDIDANRTYSAASIIKIPVLLELFKSIERNELSLKDRFILKDVFRASGSGELQFKAENSTYTIDELARRMMRDSDNSATNILMYLTGGSANVNRSLRDWGMKTTHVTNWLPDLEGDNKTTAREMATLLFNIENPKFLSLSSREFIVDYLSDIRNNRLIQAGLPSDALFIHKTGDIGKMLGDAGVVYTPGGERYIVVILVNRPYNSVAGKEYIVNASRMIYSYITTKK